MFYALAWQRMDGEHHRHIALFGCDEVPIVANRVASSWGGLVGGGH